MSEKIIDTNDIVKMNHYKSLQLNNLKTISILFEEFLLQFDEDMWKEIVLELENVLSKCDEIDYQSNATAIAYAIWHFLDRYNRIQWMCTHLLEKGYLNRAKQYDILDVGTGPSQVLFALSDHFSTLNKIANDVLCTVNSDYVERSDGFRNFMHFFVEFALHKNKQYLVPFHNGRTKDVFDLTFRYYVTHNKSITYRYDITVFNNFLTTKDFTNTCSYIIKKICKYMRNHGLIIIIGASEKSKKYKDVYSIVDNIINKPFKNQFFYGKWTKVIDEEFNYKYNNENALVLGEYFKHIVAHLKSINLWTEVPDKAKKEFEENSTIPFLDKKPENWGGVTWKMVVYQKYSKPTTKTISEKNPFHKNHVHLNDDMWQHDIKNSRNASIETEH